MSPPRHSFAVRTGREAPSAVRAALRERGAHLPAELRDDLMLLITEVVTNSVRHSGAKDGEPIEIDVREQRDGVRVVVTDPGAGFERPANLEPDHSTAGGLGLILVDRLSRKWGSGRTRAGWAVWFELGFDRDEWRADYG
jgi:anti-sigma regulatory factor (Ser/Thr protein kinase)